MLTNMPAVMVAEAVAVTALAPTPEGIMVASTAPALFSLTSTPAEPEPADAANGAPPGIAVASTAPEPLSARMLPEDPAPAEVVIGVLSVETPERRVRNLSAMGS